MKSIGLITSWRDNYGSVLQCFATKTHIKNLGFHCDLFYEDYKGIERYKHYVKRAMFLGIRSVLSKEFFQKYKVMKNNAKHAKSKIEKESWELINDFANTKLQPKGVDYKLLKYLSRTNEYVAFLAGSDQIWNAQDPINPINFLSFAPKHKRIALSPSMGTNSIAKFNRRDFKKYISGFECLSVREESGVDIINELIGKNVERLHDPTILLSPGQWRDVAINGCKRSNPYILLHFLDEPTKLAMEFIKKVQNHTNYEVIVFAYNHQVFKQIDNVIFLNGSPIDYVSLIDNAKYVCTDSFHTTLFSIYFSTLFYTFERNYKKIAPQSSRLNTLLKLYDYENRYITKDSIIDFSHLMTLELHSCEQKLYEERSKIVNYLTNSLNVRPNVTFNTPNLKDRTDCTGCGVCISSCPNGAISFKNDLLCDYVIPVVDKEKCVNCGLCEKKCYNDSFHKNKFTNNKKAYIAYNTDPIFRKVSASGGVFSAIASYIIENGGVVFGAKLDFSDKEVKVCHAKAENMEELIPLLNSKYVQSNCLDSYPIVRDLLRQGRTVLFSGTSCQVKALYSYLGSETENLYTTDLICHGVPGEPLFRDYIKYLENKYNGKIIDFSFRKKGAGNSYYVMTANFDADSDNKTVEIKMKDSSYYRMFMSGDIYRESCYRCEFANIDKPADITLGDYYEAKDDYPELFDGSVKSLRLEDGISCVITHTKSGEKLLNDMCQKLCVIPIDVSKAQRSHPQLCKPSMYSMDRNKYFKMYKIGGYHKVEKFILRRDKLKSVIKLLIRKR